MLIIAKNTSSLSPLLGGEYIDPEFLEMGSMSMQDALHCPSNIIADKLAHQITRNPNDLRSHTQRIVIFIEQHQPIALFSSLIDLFLILGEKGVALRKRMLLSAKHVLAEHQFELLRHAFLTGLNKEIALSEASQSLLRTGSKNTSPFIQKTVPNSQSSLDPIQQAQSYLEYGQIDEARLLLQEIIIEEPQQLVCHQELVSIFKKLADKDLFISFYKQLLESDMQLPLIWQQLAEEFNYERS
ncbi:MAG: hypothetical protein Q9N32_02580 [Gammaproteobacteria bacterium]|nr:hypothetical protein [Gammaproteobacteria bacterium]